MTGSVVSRRAKFNPRKILRGTVVGLVLFMALFSLLPYLIPAMPLEGDHRALAFTESVFVEIGGVELHYRTWDPPGASQGDVLLVHGFGGSTFSWRYTAPALLNAGYRVTAVDLPGFGLSERRAGLDHSQPGRSEALWTLLDKTAPGRNWCLVGHSMGGGTVAAMALERPDRVDGIVFAAGYVNLDEPRKPNPVFKYPPVRRWIKVISSRLMLKEDTVARMLASAYGRPVEPAEVEGYFGPVTASGTDAVLVDLLSRREQSVYAELSELQAPALCIWGGNDTWVPLERGERLAEVLPGAELAVIPGAGHCPMETAPELFNLYLLEFLDRL